MTRDDGFGGSARQVAENMRRLNDAERLGEALQVVVGLRAQVHRLRFWLRLFVAAFVVNVVTGSVVALDWWLTVLGWAP